MPREVHIQVSALTLNKTAQRVLNGQSLVTPEIAYIQRTLGAKATQKELDNMVMNVRQMPWASIVLPE
jgi:hypothetical protein